MTNPPTMQARQRSLHTEILEFVLTTIWLGVAFGIAFAGGIDAFSDTEYLKMAILQSLVVVFFAFIFHELAHRIIARRYGFHAVFHMWAPGLLVAFVAALMGWIFASPGAVYIEGIPDTAVGREKMGKSALAGPLTNMILALVFVGLSAGYIMILRAMPDATYYRLEWWWNFLDGVLWIGIEINAWLALLNLIPWGFFDGYKVFLWNRKAWGVAFGVSIALYAAIWWAQRYLF